jgi:hypothetical protein
MTRPEDLLYTVDELRRGRAASSSVKPSRKLHELRA